MPANYDEALALIPELQKANVEKVVKYIEFLNEKRGASKKMYDHWKDCD